MLAVLLIIKNDNNNQRQNKWRKNSLITPKLLPEGLRWPLLNRKLGVADNLDWQAVIIV